MSGELARLETEGLPPWLQAMRNVIQESISAEDVSEMVKNQVVAAKKGDAKALRFVFDHVLGGKSMQGATYVQNNYYGEDARPDRPARDKPGSNGKMRRMQARADARLPLHDAGDARGDPD